MKIKFPKLMAIMNLTPDSFSDGGKFSSPQKAIDYGLELLDQGADILDIGGESTRPGATPVSLNDELERVIPVIKGIKKLRPSSIISIDTTKYEVARQTCELGIDIINDISGLQYEPRLAELSKQYDTQLVIMHIQGKPKDMQDNPVYSNIVDEMEEFFTSQIKLAKSYGASNLILDCGIGFGKSLDDNFELLNNLERFDKFGFPQMLGVSRKSIFEHLLNIKNPIDRDLPTVLLHSLLLDKGLDIIRIHNLSEFMMLKKIVSKLQ